MADASDDHPWVFDFIIVGAGTAGSEAVLQADQATRTAGESITNIGGSAILTGGLGMGIASLLAR